MKNITSMDTFAVRTGIALVLLMALTASGANARGNEPNDAANGSGVEDAEQTAREILEKGGVQAGLIVHLGCGDGQVLAALRAGENYLVHGLEKDSAERERARAHIHGQGLYGPVSVDDWDGTRLPYAENTVNLLVSQTPEGVADDEIQRVLVPGGVALAKEEGVWAKTVKPWPHEIDEWTHYLHGPSNNAVASDEVVGPPRRLQWVNPPSWSRSHDHLSSLSAAVLSGGRLYYILDKGPAASVAMPPKWTLIARDAFNGLPLWERSIDQWEWHLRPFRSGPTDLARRLVADNGHVYVTLGYGKPVTALDVVSGETIHEYEQTVNTREIIVSDGVLYLLVGKVASELASEVAERVGAIGESWPARGYPELRPETELMAVDADTGETLWHKTGKETRHVMPTTLAVADDRVFFQNADHVMALDAQGGRELWRSKRPVHVRRPAWSAPTLVIHDGVVLSADRRAPVGDNDWMEFQVTHSHTVKAQPGELMAFSAEDGRKLWSASCKESFNAPVDVLVADGLVWTGELARRNELGILQGRDPHTGQVKRTRPSDLEFYDPDMGHARCYRNKATNSYLLTGRSGVEFVDVKSGEAIPHHWVRGACQYGILPGNGLLYAPPHPCACFILAKLNSFHALAPGEPVDLEETGQANDRLEKGPAHGEVKPQRDSFGDWPTYRHDPARSGSTAAAVPSDDLALAWETELDEPLTPPVAADGRVYVASTDTQTLHVLDVGNGERLWRFTAGGRVDSPPTVWNGRVFLGSADGWVYCLRAEDGALAWRYRAAAKNRLIMADGQLESAWPVHGSVLVLPAQDSPEKAVVYAAAGRSGYLDGGIVLVRLDAEGGGEMSRHVLDSRDPETGHQPYPLPQPTSGTRYRPGTTKTSASRPISMPGVLNDILSARNDSVFMRHFGFDLDGTPQDETKPHLHSAAGFLDDSWWHRSYWFVGQRMYSGYGGWPNMAHLAPSGRLLVLNGRNVFGFGRDEYERHGGSHPGLEPSAMGTGASYDLFLQDMSFDPRRNDSAVVFPWRRKIDICVRGMALAKKTLFVAGPRAPLQTDDPLAVWEGRSGGFLMAISSDSGEKRAAYPLDAPPVFDGLIATPGRLLFSTTDGRVVSWVKETPESG